MTQVPLLEIEGLTAEIDGVTILNGVNLVVNPGEIHAIMGPNGAGKSTLAKVLAGHPAYEVTGGSVRFKGEALIDMEPEERAHAGLFMSFQYPLEIAGVTNMRFLETAYNSMRKARGEEPLLAEEFALLLQNKMAMMEVKPEFIERNLNEGFSGGEKKRNEVLQMALLEPTLAILDETDSGLDIDAMRVVACGVKKSAHADMGLLLITHYQRLLNYIAPHYVHVMVDGRIVQSGGSELALTLEEKGYDWIDSSSEVMAE